jgi:hypothetical protein
MPPVGFELIIPAGERPHTYALDRTATGTGPLYRILITNPQLHMVWNISPKFIIPFRIEYLLQMYGFP